MASDIIARGLAAKAVADLDEFKRQTEEELAGKADLIDGKVPSSQLPSYVDDVSEYESLDLFPQPGERGKIYVALDTGYIYRWSGSEYIQIGGHDIILGDSQISGAPMLESLTVGDQIYNIPAKITDLQDDVGLLVVDDKSDVSLAVIDDAEWENLKIDHYIKKSGSVFPNFEESRYKVVLGNAEHIVRFTLNSASQAKAMFLVEEDDGADVLYYEITLFVTDMGNGQTRIVMRCATIMSEPAI